jgi:hypothetical protein
MLPKDSPKLADKDIGKLCLMSSDIPGITPSLYQDIYPAAYPAENAMYQRPGMPTGTKTGPGTMGGDSVSFSPQAMQQARGAGAQTGTEGGKPLSEAEQRQIDELEQTDRRVRAHEQAHIAAGGGLTSSGASFQYRTGPDGKQYAVGGEVQIDTSEEKTPDATIRKAQRIKAAALAPADPSGQDRSVAASADAMATKARQELAQMQAQQGGKGARAATASGIAGGVGQIKSAQPVRYSGGVTKANTSDAKIAYIERQPAPATVSFSA